MIELPNSKGIKKPVKLKYCKLCGREFYGISVQKFCKTHLDPRGAERNAFETKRKQEVRARNTRESQNRIYRHTFNVPMKVLFPCDVCGRNFEVIVSPKIYVYPKCCESHRTEYQRENYRRMYA